MQSKEKLAEEIHSSNVMVGNYLEYIKTLRQYINKTPWKEFLLPIYFSLLNSMIIELYKIFDKSGSDTEKQNIFALINLINEKEKISRILSPHKKLINNICNLRNKYYAHNTGYDFNQLIKENIIELHEIENLQKNINKICIMAYPNIYKNTITKDTRELKRWIPYIDKLIQKEKINNDNEIIQGDY